MAEKTWEQKMTEIKFPPVGNNKPYLVTLDGKPFAGFNTRKEAEAAREMYSANVKGSAAAGSSSSNSKMNWGVIEV